MFETFWKIEIIIFVLINNSNIICGLLHRNIYKKKYHSQYILAVLNQDINYFQTIIITYPLPIL